MLVTAVLLMSPPEVLEKISAEGNIKQIIASQEKAARERDIEEQFDAPMYHRNTNYQYNYDYYYQLNVNAMPQETTEQAQERPTAKVKRSMQFRTKFWTTISLVAVLPLLNSALVNAYCLSKNIAQQVVLSHQLDSVLAEKKDLENKLGEFNSDSGLKRAIKQEMNLVESNEIVVKIVAA